jgi:probable HAF family extracellular repeat protein
MTTHLKTKTASQRLFTIVIAFWCGVALAPAQAQAQAQAKAKKTQYNVSNLASLGGTNSAGNSINDQSWVAGYSRLTGDQARHATLWRNGSTAEDLGTLAGPNNSLNSNVTWNVKNTHGIIVGISQTATPEPLGEHWSSAAFYGGAFGFINLGFVWEQGQMRGLPNFPGGNNGFATGANNLRQVVGWAENGVHDPTCCCSQVLQFRPAMWSLGPPADQIHDLPLIPGDTSGAATAINDNGQIVGISGICDQAVGRHTAKHAVLWENGTVTDIYPNPPAPWWNTPTAINQHGDVVGFAGDPAFVEGDVLHAFIWTRDNGIQALKPLRGHVPEHVDSEAYGINERRQVVGVSCDTDGVDCRAVIWDHGVYPTDLNEFKGGYSARLETAKDINNLGEITGRAIESGVRTAYKAVPVSQP